MAPAYSPNYEFRALTLAAVIWLPFRALLSLWGTLGQSATVTFEPWRIGSLESVYFAGPAPHYFVEIIAAAAGVLALLAMLSTGRTPHAGWIALLVVPALAFSACCYLLELKARQDDLILDLPDKELFSAPKILSVIFLDIEVGFIAWVLWKWRRRWLEKNRSQPLGSDTAPQPDSPAALPSTLVRKQRSPGRMVFGCVAGTTLLAWAGILFLPSAGLRAEWERDTSGERRLSIVSKADHPLLWAKLAREVAQAREGRKEIAGTINCWMEIITLDDAVYGPDSLESEQDILSLIGVLRRSGRAGQSEPWLRRILANVEKLPVVQQWYRSEHRLALARVLIDTGRLAEARDLYEKVIVVERDRRGKFPADEEEDYRKLLEKMGESPAAIEEKLNSLGKPHP